VLRAQPRDNILKGIITVIKVMIRDYLLVHVTRRERAEANIEFLYLVNMNILIAWATQFGMKLCKKKKHLIPTVSLVVGYN
jgi:hypothetical protein